MYIGPSSNVGRYYIYFTQLLHEVNIAIIVYDYVEQVHVEHKLNCINLFDTPD